MNTHTHTGAAVEGQAAGGVEVLDEELRQNNLVSPQRVVPVLPVKHQVVLIVGIWGETVREREVFSVTEKRKER